MTIRPRSTSIPPGGETPRRLADSINGIIKGRTDNYGELELSTTTSTTVTNTDVNDISVIHLSPISASAAGVAWWISARARGSFTVTHPSGSAGREFAYGWNG